MIRMILADDEPIITRGIQKLVDWSSLGIDVVGEYQDGKEAMDGLISLKPDIALLDISMPKKTGIDILKECSALNIPVQIIFISGFQDFQYAKDALTYGAKDYLLKPVIKEELMTAIEGCISCIRTDMSGISQEQGEEEQEEIPYERLIKVEETTYLPVLMDILWSGTEGSQEKKLIRFSLISYVEQYLSSKDMGIIFTKDHHIVLVLKGIDREEAKKILYELMQNVEEETRHRIGMVVGDTVDSMGEIPEGYGRCLGMLGYFFFYNQIPVPILFTGVPVYAKPVPMEVFADIRNQLVESIVSQDRKNWDDRLQNFFRKLCVLSEGKKEDACFHFCSTIRIMEERFYALGIKGLGLDVKDILEEGRLTKNYREMSDLYGGYLEKYMDLLKDSVVSNDKKDMIHAKEYIEAHYRENLTLEVLAGEIHMNPYYFSSYFKKNAGENFKDYVNKIRLKHALSLLVSTDMKAYEIAEKVGFRDARSFSELFQRSYGETPVSYRKRVKQQRKI